MKKFTDEEIEQILLEYDNGAYITHLNKKYHTTKIRDLLIQNNRTVPERQKKQGGSKRKYKFDENYFEQIDSKDKAYFLGFIYADGFITKRSTGQNLFGLTLAEIEPIDKLKHYMNCDKPVGYYKKTSSYSDKSYEYKFALTSNKLVSDLEKHGVIERKTLVLTFPNLREDLIPHFIRGYFDGDGSVYLHTPSERCSSLGINIYGTKEFLEDMVKNFKFMDNPCIYKEKRKETNCWNFKVNSNIRSLSLYHYLYKDCDDLYLSRKKDKFENFIKERGSTTIIGSPTNNREYLNLCYLED